MQRIKRFTAAIILAATVFLTASFGRDSSPPDEPPEEPSTGTPVAYDTIAEELTLRKRAHRSEVARARSEDVRKQALEAERLARIAAKPEGRIAVSRGQDYVGKAQTYEATFYTAFCPTGCIGVTASGYDVSSTIYYDGMRILAAPKHIPLYSIMRVTMADGSSFDGIVLDRGGDIGDGRLDILVKSRQEAYALGRKAVEVRMVRRGK